MKKSTKKILETILDAVILIFMLWVAASFFNVICNNLDPNPTYWSWNFFIVLFG